MWNQPDGYFSDHQLISTLICSSVSFGCLFLLAGWDQWEPNVFYIPRKPIKVYAPSYLISYYINFAFMTTW